MLLLFLSVSFSLTAAEMVLIKGGTFTMGGSADDSPKHKVQVSPFHMDKFEVTQKDYF